MPCARCDSPLGYDGLCMDTTCPFDAVQQDDPKGWIGHPEPPIFTCENCGIVEADNVCAMSTRRYFHNVKQVRVDDRMVEICDNEYHWESDGLELQCLECGANVTLPDKWDTTWGD